MNTQKIMQKIIDGFHKAAVELEELQVQVALGKAEAHDLFNDQKKRFKDYIHTVKYGINKSSSKIQDETVKITELLGEIGEHLVQIKTETKEEFEAQKKNLLSLLQNLENYIRANKALNMVYSDLLNEIEVFKLKLEILKYRFDLKKLTIKDEFEKNKMLFLQKIKEIKEDSGTHEKWDNFQTEMAEAYKHLWVRTPPFACRM